MTVAERIEELLLEKFKEEGYQDFFIVEIIHTASANKVEVFLESDTILNIQKCAKLNRYLQGYLDEEGQLGEKYTLDVSSPGVGKPLKMLRQYQKNVGRKLEIFLTEGKPVTGVLKAIGENHITVEQTKGKKKKMEVITHELSFDNIKRAIVKISF